MATRCIEIIAFTIKPEHTAEFAEIKANWM